MQTFEVPAAPLRRCLKLLIVDNEPSMHEAISRLCQNNEAVHVVGQVGSGAAAIGAAEALRPDVMFIGVELPDMSGFDVLRASSEVARPLAIMTSHRADHALTAFTAGAMDYLLKPVAVGRLSDAIDRARLRYEVEDEAKVGSTHRAQQTLGRRPRFLVGERQQRLYPLDIDAIDYIEADGNYVTIRVGDTAYISRGSIKRLSKDLEDFGYVRIERSVLLNIRAVSFAERAGHGTLAFTLSSGVCLHSSKTYRQNIRRVLPWHHSRSLNEEIE